MGGVKTKNERPGFTGRRIEASEFLNTCGGYLLLAKLSLRLKVLSFPVTVYKVAVVRNSFETLTRGVHVLRSPNLLFILKKLFTTGS